MNTKKNKIDHSNRGVYSLEESKDFFEKLREALQDKKINHIEEFLNDNKGVKSLIGLRGKKGGCLKLLKDSIVFLLQERDFDINQIEQKNPSELLDLIHLKELNEKNIDYLARIAFYLREEELFDFLRILTLENKNKFKNQDVYYWLLHSIASWDHVVENDFESSIEKNIEVIKNTEKDGDKILYWKAKSGLTFSKAILPKLKIQDFLKFAEELIKLGDSFEAFRSYIEAARAYLNLSKQQGVEDVGFESLKEAKKIALEALDVSKEIGYANIEIIAGEILEDVYGEMIKKTVTLGIKLKETSQENLAQSDFYKRQKEKLFNRRKKQEEYQVLVQILRKEYVYQTSFSQKYKDSVYSHL